MNTRILACLEFFLKKGQTGASLHMLAMVHIICASREDTDIYVLLVGLSGPRYWLMLHDF
jgi:hypothetical protein